MGFMGNAGMLAQEVSKPQNPLVTLGRLSKYFVRYWPLLIAVLLVLIGTVWAAVTIPDLTQAAVDCYLNPVVTACHYATITTTMTFDDKIAGLVGIVIKALALYVGSAAGNGLAFYLFAWAGQHVLREMREDILKRLHTLSIGYYADSQAGELMSRVTGDIDTINQVLGFGLISVFGGALTIVWIIIKMLQENVGYALVSFTVLPLMLIATFWLSTQARRAYRKTRSEFGNINAELEEGIAGVREVQAFNRQDENIEKFREANATNRDANVRAVAYSSALSPTLDAFNYVALGIVACTGGLALLGNATFAPLFGGAISVGLIFAFIQFVQRFGQPIQQIALLWTNIQSAVAGSERIFGLLDTKPDIVDKPNAIEMPPIVGKVVFNEAKAEYKKGVPVLRGVSLTAEPGQTIAIVGPTGAGKTTIVNLLPRFYDVSSGSVTIDGIDVRDVQAATLRKQIGIVLQDSFLFSDTVMNNIRYGHPEATDEQVVAAAKLSMADQFIDRLPEKYNTILGERGSGLSQGQRQLLAIARAALSDPRLLILDEATSSVDTRTERLIQTALEKLLAGRTSFVIAHRLSTIRNANQVLMVRNGEIIERGTHNELIAKQGAYYDLYMSQFNREMELESGTPLPASNSPAIQNT